MWEPDDGPAYSHSGYTGKPGALDMFCKLELPLGSRSTRPALDSGPPLRLSVPQFPPLCSEHVIDSPCSPSQGFVWNYRGEGGRREGGMGVKAPRAPISDAGLRWSDPGATARSGPPRLGDPPPLKHVGSPLPDPREIRGRRAATLSGCLRCPAYADASHQWSAPPDTRRGRARAPSAWPRSCPD